MTRRRRIRLRYQSSNLRKEEKREIGESLSQKVLSRNGNKSLVTK
jgi:hypothetical protein